MKETQKNILLFSTADWDNPFLTNKQHMAVLFAEHGYRVLYVDSLGLRKPSLHARDMKRIFGRLKKALPIPRKVRPNIWRVSPLVLPFHAHPRIKRLNDLLLRAVIRWQLLLLRMRRPIILTYTPVVSGLCAAVKNSGVVYHCVDDLGASPGIDVQLIREEEKRLAAVADCCFVTSRNLLYMLSPVFRHVEYDPNVCDIALFQRARQHPAEPADLKPVPRPRLVFIGALSQYKVDFGLMRRVAELLLDVHWLLIGDVGEGQPGTQGPPVRDNIHLLGPRPYKELPSYLAHGDVAVLPAARNTYTASMFPMKFFEYLASGLPVVSTRLPALEEFESLYFPAETAEEFAAQIRAVLAGARKDAAAIEAVCREHTWEARFQRMERRMLEMLSRPSQARDTSR